MWTNRIPSEKYYNTCRIQSIQKIKKFRQNKEPEKYNLDRSTNKIKIWTSKC